MGRTVVCYEASDFRRFGLCAFRVAIERRLFDVFEASLRLSFFLPFFRFVSYYGVGFLERSSVNFSFPFPSSFFSFPFLSTATVAIVGWIVEIGISTSPLSECGWFLVL